MKIYYDLTARNIDFEGIGRFFGSGSMEAIADGNNVYARYKNSNVNEIYMLFSEIQKQDGSPAGANVTEVVDYLNEEFDKGIIIGQGSFNLLSSTKTITDPRIRDNNKIITQPLGTVNEVLGVTVNNGSFTVTRTFISALTGFTNNLTFDWFRL